MSTQKPTEEEELAAAMVAKIGLTVYKHPDPGLAIHNAVVAASAVEGKDVKVIDALSVPPGSDPMNPKNAMDIVKGHLDDGHGVLICHNILHAFGENKMAQIVIQKYCMPTRDNPPRIVFVEDGTLKVPPILEAGMKLINAKHPPVEELLKEVKRFVKDFGLSLPGNGEMLYKIAYSLTGVFRNKANDLMKECLAVMETLDPMWLANRKAAMITEMSGGILSFMPAAKSGIGGAEAFVKWAKRKVSKLISKSFKDFGGETPKGVVLYGPAGTGKSLSPKVLAGEFGLPCVRLDLSKIPGGIVGDSERNMNLALSAIDAMAPCFVVIDEGDKQADGAKGPSGDSGATKRTLGSLLTWLQERTAPAFIVLTSNDPEALPPEMTRKGRFDEMFIMDVPTEEERKAILAIHVGKLPRKITLDLDSIAKRTQGYSGSELELLVSDALDLAYEARLETKSSTRDLSMEDIDEVLRTTSPNIVIRAKEYNALMTWAKTHGVKSARTGAPLAAEPTTEAPNTGEFLRGSTKFKKPE